MLVITQASPSGALSARRWPVPSSSYSIRNSAFSSRKSHFEFSKKPRPLTLAKADKSGDSTAATSQSSSAAPKPPTPFENTDETVFVGDENVPLEGVIQFDKPDSYDRFKKWGRVALIGGGDFLALLVFAAIGRYNHGLSVFDVETFRTVDPFLAGWFLGAYFLGGYGEDGRGMNGVSKGVVATAKSWAVGIPLGFAIRAARTAHFPPYSFILVTMGSTFVLLIGWRALLYSLLPGDKSKKSDVYRQGSPFELFELLTSLIRRW